MFDIRKIQEQVIFGAVKNARDDKMATKIVYGYMYKIYIPLWRRFKVYAGAVHNVLHSVY